MAIKFCVKCGKKFNATGREVICPACKEQAAEDAKRAAVLKAKRASWNGESVPVRISGRASTVIRAYGAEKCLPFAAALDELLKQTACFQGMSIKWEEIKPYKSRRRDKATSTAQDVPQEVKQEEVKQEAKQEGKETTSKATSKTSTAKKAVKTSTSRAAAGKKE